MRFVHTADLHLGRRLSQLTLTDDFEHMTGELAALAQRSGARALVVAGDVFDSPTPSESATRLWDDLVLRMVSSGVAVLAITGDVDAGARLTAAGGVAASAGVHAVNDLTGALEPVVVDGVNFWLVPYQRPSDVVAWAEAEEMDHSDVDTYEAALSLVLDHVRAHAAFAARPNVAVCHQYVMERGTNPPERADSERHALSFADDVSRDVFAGFDYVALGHLHIPQAIGTDTCRYAGSPLALSASEAGREKSFCVVGISGEAPSVEVRHRLVAVSPMRAVRVERGSLAELEARGRAEGEQKRSDLVFAEVTDAEPTDAQARLRAVWENLVQVSFEGVRRTAERLEAQDDVVDVDKDVRDLFRDFFQSRTGRAMGREEEQVLEIAFERVAGKGGDVA